MLGEAVGDFSETLGAGFLGMPSAPTAEVLRAYARDHFHDSPKDKEGG